jgi:hypothetical protein
MSSDCLRLASSTGESERLDTAFRHKVTADGGTRYPAVGDLMHAVHVRGCIAPLSSEPQGIARPNFGV